MELQDEHGKPVTMELTGTLEDNEPFSAEVPVVMVSPDDETSVGFMIQILRSIMEYIEEETEQEIKTAFVKIPLDSKTGEYGLINLTNGEHIRMQDSKEQA